MKSIKKLIALSVFLINSTSLLSMENNSNSQPRKLFSPIPILSPRSGTPENAHFSSNIKILLTSPDENNVNQKIKDNISLILSKELKNYFYKQFVHQSGHKIYDDIIYDENCENLALAAIYADIRPKNTINLTFSFPKNRVFARDAIMRIINTTVAGSWINIAATFELLKFDMITSCHSDEQKYDFVMGTSVRAKRLVAVCQQNINTKAKIAALKLLIDLNIKKCPYDNKLRQQMINAINTIKIFHSPESHEYKYQETFIDVINDFCYGTSNTRIVQGMQTEIAELRELEQEKKFKHGLPKNTRNHK